MLIRDVFCFFLNLPVISQCTRYTGVYVYVYTVMESFVSLNILGIRLVEQER